MKKEVTRIPQDKDFLEVLEERFGKEIWGPWIYIDQLTIDMLVQKDGVSHVDSESRLHIPYGNIIIDGYRFDDYAWYRIHSINAENVKYGTAVDPKEIFFISIK